MFEDVFVIIRSVGEISTDNCKNLIQEAGFKSKQIEVINVYPFAKALRVSYQKGIDSGAKWLMCVDADVLIDPKAINIIYALASKANKNIFELKGFIYDKFYDGPRLGGIHWYRCSLLKVALNHTPNDPEVLRPEATTIKKMTKLGYPWQIMKVIVGVHGYSQSPKDIWRTSYMHGKKHRSDLEYFIRLWTKRCLLDDDYAIALSAFMQGLKAPQALTEITNPYDNKILNNFSYKWLSAQEVRHICSTQISFEYQYHFPLGVGLTSKFTAVKALYDKCTGVTNNKLHRLILIAHALISFYVRIKIAIK